MTTTVTFFVLGLAAAAFAVLVQLRRELLASVGQLSTEVEQIAETLEQHREILETLEWRTASEYERERREWDRLVPITMPYIEQLQPGETQPFVARSHIWPFDEALTERFQYKHESLGATKHPEFGHEVIGHQRANAFEEWEPFKFYVNDQEATTSGGAGTLRRERTESDTASTAA